MGVGGVRREKEVDREEEIVKCTCVEKGHCMYRISRYLRLGSKHYSRNGENLLWYRNMCTIIIHASLRIMSTLSSTFYNKRCAI